MHGVLSGCAFTWLLVDQHERVVAAHVDAALTAGQAEAALVGHDVAEAFTALPEVGHTVSKLLEHGGGVETVVSDARVVDVAVEPRAMDDASALVVAVDVTSHAHEEETALGREHEIRQIFRQLPAAIWSTDRELRITHFYGNVQQTVGIPEDQIVGSSVQRIIGGNDPSERALARHLAALAGTSSSFRYRFKNRWYEMRVQPRRGPDGEIRGCIGAAFDVTQRQRADERLAANEQLLSESQRLAHVGTWVWDVASNRVTWTEELYRVYGIDPAAFTGTYEAFLARVHPDDLELTKSVLFAALRNGGRFTYDHRILRPDGSVRMLHTSGIVVRAPGGGPARMLGACSDVTDTWESRQSLERTVSLLEATLESTADGTLVVDSDGRVTTFNQPFLALWRIPPAIAERRNDRELIDYVLDQLTDPDDFLRTVKTLYEHADEESFDVLRFKDGRVFERYSRPQRVGGTVVGRVWSFRDVTQRERLLARAMFLSDATRLLTSLDVESALEGVARLAVPLLADVCAFDLLGSGTPRRLLAIARSSASELSNDIPALVLAGHSVVRTENQRSQISVPLLTRGTVVGALTLVAAPHRTYAQTDLDLAEELGRRSAMSLENSRLYRTTKEAVEAREEFLAIAAHEIRGPLSSMRVAVQSLRRGGAQVDKLLDVIERGERRLARFVDELLDLGRLRTGSVRFVVEPVSLAQVARDAISGLSPELAKSGSALSVRIEHDAVGSWDKARLTQVVSNLLSNAMRFGLGHPIEVVVAGDADRGEISVTDHGIGIPTEKLSRIFEPFERAVPPRHFGGLGLGLYIARTIVQSFGGTLTVRSVVGQGSTFTIELPLRGAS